MGDPIIINARRQLGWRRRIFSDVVTLGLWLLWGYLWLPAFHKLQQVIRLHVGLETGALEVFETVDPISVRHSLIALLGTCVLLLAWTLLPRRKVTGAHDAVAAAQYAALAGLDVRGLDDATRSRRAVVQHDEQGRIVSVSLARD